MTKLMEHPDANLLAAFAERALSGVERVSVLGHLADCARCREIVFLAQEAAGEEAVPMIVPKPVKSRAVWMRWSVAVVSAVLLATVGVTSWKVYEHTQQDKTGVASETVAKVMPEPQQALMKEKQADQLVSNTSVHANATQVGAGPAMKLDSAPSKLAAAPIEMKRSEGYSRATGSVSAAPVASSQSAQYGFAAPQQARSVMEQEQSLGEQKSQKTVAASAYNERAYTANYADRGGSAAKAAPQAMKAQSNEAAPASVARTTTVEVSADTSQAIETTPNTYTAEVVPDKSLRAKKAEARPGGKPLADSVTVGGNQLALDLSGKLFVSTGDGMNWREVKKQWKGKATRLTLTPSGDTAVLWCDDGHAWVSKDRGESWQPYNAPMTQR